MADIHFEDLAPGAVSVLGSQTVSAEEITAFARDYDAQPFHLGEDSARDTFVGRQIASGWHTIALQMRVLCDAWLLRSASMGSPGVDRLEWLRPVLPGDAITVRQTILDATPSRSRPEMGVVRVLLETLNDAGDLVMRQTNPIMLRRRGFEPVPRPLPASPGRGGFDALRGRTDGRAQGLVPFEDAEIGATEMLGEHRFTAEDIKDFASRFDPQPFHLDEDAAARSSFGRLAASGWQTASLWMRHLVRHREAVVSDAKATGQEPPRFGPSPGFKDLRWIRPVFAGDTVRFATTLVDKRVSASRPGWGLVFNHNTGWNGDGEKVFEFSGSGFVATGPVAEAAA